MAYNSASSKVFSPFSADRRCEFTFNRKRGTVDITIQEKGKVAYVRQLVVCERPGDGYREAKNLHVYRGSKRTFWKWSWAAAADLELPHGTGKFKGFKFFKSPTDQWVDPGHLLYLYRGYPEFLRVVVDKDGYWQLCLIPLAERAAAYAAEDSAPK